MASETVEIKGRVVGEIVGDCYITHRYSKKHFYKKLRGYPISVSVLKYLKSRNVKVIYIKEHRQNGTVHRYKTFVSDFDAIREFQEYPFDAQKCIPLRLWQKVD